MCNLWNACRGNKPTLLVSVLVSGLLMSTAGARTVPYRYVTHPAVAQARQDYTHTWGVDSLSVKSVESGNTIRFSYRVLDPDRAKAFHETGKEPSLIDPRADVTLPAVSPGKAGRLPRSSTLEAGKWYGLAFSNKGRVVQPGHRVSVIIGQFRADDLVVR